MRCGILQLICNTNFWGKIMELFNDERTNRDFLFDKLKDNAEIAASHCLTGKETPGPYKHIYIPVKKSLEIWCFKQDICIYQKLFDKSIDFRNIAVTTDEEIHLKVDLEGAVNNEDIGMPFVIIETKMANTNTHELLASSEKTKMIKTIFPYCKSFLLVFGSSPPPRVYRLCSGFDEILFLDKRDGEMLKHKIKKITEAVNMAYYYVISVVSY
jgi:hypothetical protein